MLKQILPYQKKRINFAHIMQLYYSIIYILSVLGHEGVIKVIKHKTANNNVKIGDRLTFSIADSCLQCERCKDGIEQKCTRLFKVQYSYCCKLVHLIECFLTSKIHKLYI